MKNNTHTLRAKSILNFFTFLTISLLLVFFIHVFILKKLKLPPFENSIVLSYIINYILAGGIFLTLFFLKKKYLDQLGYLFMFSSFLKFITFFTLFYHGFREVDGISRSEFLVFFIPYATALFVETTSLIKILNTSIK